MFPGLDIIFLSRRGSVFLLVYITIRKIVIQNLLCPRYVFRPKLDPVLFIFFTWGDRKVRIKMLSFLYLLLFRDEISSNNAATYMQLIHCNNACIKRAHAL